MKTVQSPQHDRHRVRMWSQRGIPVFAMLALTLVAGQSEPAAAQDRMAIRGGTILTMTGDRLESGTILISDGRIEAIGADVEIPVDAKVLDAAGMVVMPGIIDVHSSAGMSQANEQNAFVPFLSVVDSIDPILDYFEESRRNGVTAAAVVPGNSTMIGGRAAIVKTAGQYVNDMIVKRDAGLKISLAPASGTSRMGHLARLRRELRKALEDEAESESAPAEPEGETGGNQEAPSGDEENPNTSETPRTQTSTAQQETEKAAREALRALLKGEMPAIIYCPEAMDVAAALDLVDEFKLRPILVLGRECYKAAPLISARGLTAVLDDTLVYWRTDPQTRKDEKIIVPKQFLDQGAAFVFQTSSSGVSQGTHYHWFQAATAVRYGMPREDALRALTIDAARLLGIDDLTGSIEPGKDADLVILTGDPLGVDTWVETTIVDGKVVYQRSEDEQLRLLFHPEEDTN